MARRVYVKEDSRGDSWAALLLVAVAFVYAKAILIILAIALAVYLTARLWQRHKEVQALRMVNQAAISMEADHQDLLASMGDPYGVYGQFDPYTMPLTRPILDNYDDGLRQWR